MASLEEVTSFGPDQKDGSTAWSYYEVFAARQAGERERLWELADAELEAARKATPRILDRELPARDLVKLKSEFTLKSDLVSMAFFSSRILQFFPAARPMIASLCTPSRLTCTVRWRPVK